MDNGRYIWVVETLTRTSEQGRYPIEGVWEPMKDGSFSTRENARMSKEVFEYDYPKEKFRIQKYVPQKD